MPYIDKSKREKFEPFIQNLLAFLNDDQDNFGGNINYIITAIMKRIDGPLKYKKINELIGALECAKLEYYRRIGAPYEDEKIKQNGDVE